MKENIIILEKNSSKLNYWKDIWHYRELFYILAWRDISVRYKQTVFGVLWAILRPFLTMIVFTVIFSKLAKLPSEGNIPYAIMVFAGMLPWTLFSTALTEASNSLIANANMISKVYFPRLIIPSATVITSFIDFLIGLGLMFGLMIYYHFLPGWQIIFLPVFMLLAFLASLGPGLWVTGLNVKYRDFRYIVPFVVQFGLYISPVGFSSNVIPEKYRLIYSLNPMVGVIDGFRWCVLGDGVKIYWPGFYVSMGVILGFMWVGITSFRKLERSFADLI
jgi:lipopolysaccharide transport system permease protein